MGSRVVSGRLGLIVLSVSVAVVQACTSDDGGVRPADTEAARPSQTADPSLASAGPPGIGPRDLPPTFVDLELDDFPRPPDEACADNGDVIEVGADDSIAAALGRARPGSTVLVDSGAYVERPDESSALAIEIDNVCLRAREPGRVVIEAASKDQATGISLGGSQVVVEGLTVRGFEAGVILETDEGATQEDVTLAAVRVEEMDGDFRDGVVALGDNSDLAERTAAVDGLLLLDVHVDGADLGISCNAGPCDHWWVERSSVRGRAGADSSGADTLAIENGRQVAIVDSTFEAAEADGIDLKAQDAVVYGAQVFDVGRNGIKAWHGVDVITSIVDGTGADAALVGQDEGRYRYVNSLFAHHGQPGEAAYNATWSYDSHASGIIVEIVNCIFFENSVGGFWVPDDATVTIRNTIFSAPAGDDLITFGDGESIGMGSLDEFLSAGHGTDSFRVDPEFVDPDGRDYSTLPGSPARDAAERIGSLDRDIWGNARVAGTGPDIGPVESTN